MLIGTGPTASLSTESSKPEENVVSLFPLRYQWLTSFTLTLRCKSGCRLTRPMWSFSWPPTAWEQSSTELM